MDIEGSRLAALSESAAVSMMGRLRDLHPGSGGSPEASLAANSRELQAISGNAKQACLRRLFAEAKAARAAGGVGAERRFDRAMAGIEAVDQGWDDAVDGSFRRQFREWVDSGEPVLGAGGWIKVTVRPYPRGSLWWTDAGRADQWCRTIARDVFTGIISDPRARTGDTAGLTRLSEPTIGPALDVSVMAMLGDFQDQQRYDALRHGVHPLQAQEAADRIHAMRGPLLATCRAELHRLLQEWNGRGSPGRQGPGQNAATPG